MDDLIYCQRDIPKAQWRYGFRSSAATGCGWIATYNALRLMDCPADPVKLIRYYERQLPLIHGNAGTLALAPLLYFKSRGFHAEHTARYDRFDALAKASDVSVMFYYWRSKWKLGAHFVTVSYKDGVFTGYNTYSNSTGPDPYGPSLAGFVKKKKYFGAVLIGIKKRENM